MSESTISMTLFKKAFHPRIKRLEALTGTWQYPGNIRRSVHDKEDAGIRIPDFHDGETGIDYDVCERLYHARLVAMATGGRARGTRKKISLASSPVHPLNIPT